MVAKLELKWAFTESKLNVFYVFKCIGQLSSHIKNLSGIHFNWIVNDKLRIWQPCQKSNEHGCQINQKVSVYWGYDKNLILCLKSIWQLCSHIEKVPGP